MLTLWFYARYAHQSKIKNPNSKIYYLLVVICCALGLMSKPMLVTLPFVLLLLDYWPLGRSTASGQIPHTQTNPLPWPKLLLEKIPLFLISAAICVVTLLVQDSARRAAENITFPARLNNALISTATYVFQFFYPANLAAFYPFPPDGWPAWEIALSALFVIGVTVAVFRWRKHAPYLLVGWLWYLIMLVPVIGLVPVGAQAHADRYTYLPEIGLAIALTWTHRRLVRKMENPLHPSRRGCHHHPRRARRRRTCSNRLLARQRIPLDPRPRLHRQQFRRRKQPRQLPPQTRRLDEAIAHASAAIAIRPDYADAQNCLGFALYRSSRAEDSIPHFQTALKAKPAFAAAHNNYGLALLQLGHLEAAITEMQSAVKFDPQSSDAHGNLGIALLRSGQPQAAVVEYQKAIDLAPDSASANNNLAWLLATCPAASVRNGPLSVQLAQHANQLANGRNLIILRTLAAAFAESQKFPEAVQTANQALQLATNQGLANWAKTLRSDLGLYQSGQPLRDFGHQYPLEKNHL